MCYRPITLKSGSVVPCNKCPKCISRRVSAWSFRMYQESLVASSSDFITLTYDTKFVPICDQSRQLVLRKSDLQLFFKRLRKSQCGNGPSPIKYYAVGEYGGISQRPHYHVILFNAERELIEAAWRDPKSHESLGFIYYGSVSGASVGYCLKYMSKPKKWTKPLGIPPEFAVMSKGLGVGYIEKYAEWHVQDLLNRMYCTLPGGIKLSMPRYYKDKIYWELERAAISAVYSVQAVDAMLEKLTKQTLREFTDEQKAIDASFDRMYSSSKKTLI